MESAIEVKAGSLAAALAKNAGALEHAFDLVALVERPRLRLREINRSGRYLLRLKADHVLDDQTWVKCFAPKTWTLLTGQAVAAVRAGRTWRGSGTLRVPGGPDVPTRLVLVPYTAELAVLAAIDDSALHHMQFVLRHEQMLLHALLDALPDAVYFKDLQSRFLRANHAIARRMGASGPEGLVGRTDFDYFTSEHAQQAFEDEQRIIATGEPLLDAEERETWPDGRITWVATSKFPLRNTRSEIIGTIGISRDITKRKQAEQQREAIAAQLLEAQKMESIGRLAAGVAHEINTPMQFINDNAHFLVQAFAQLGRVISGYRTAIRIAGTAGGVDPATMQSLAELEAENETSYMLEEIPRTLTETIEGVARVARIVRSLRDFAHPGSPDKKPADVNRAVETVVAMSRHEWKLVAEVVTELAPDLPSVPCVIDEVHQALLNLLINAAHAIASAGTQDPARGLGRIVVRTSRQDGFIRIEVSDTGVGIPPGIRDKIFEPFFTTKPPGQGTGQGLALVHAYIVKNHRGRVDFTSEVNRGTTFMLDLPLPAEHPALMSCATAQLP